MCTCFFFASLLYRPFSFLSSTQALVTRFAMSPLLPRLCSSLPTVHSALLAPAMANLGFLFSRCRRVYFSHLYFIVPAAAFAVFCSWLSRHVLILPPFLWANTSDCFRPHVWLFFCCASVSAFAGIVIRFHHNVFLCRYRRTWY